MYLCLIFTINIIWFLTKMGPCYLHRIFMFQITILTGNLLIKKIFKTCIFINPLFSHNNLCLFLFNHSLINNCKITRRFNNKFDIYDFFRFLFDIIHKIFKRLGIQFIFEFRMKQNDEEVDTETLSASIVSSRLVF